MSEVYSVKKERLRVGGLAADGMDQSAEVLDAALDVVEADLNYRAAVEAAIARGGEDGPWVSDAAKACDAALSKWVP